MDIPVLYEDDALIVIDKPAGIVVNNARSVQAPTIQDWITERLHFPAQPKSVSAAVPATDADGNPVYDKAAEFASRAGIVHRIDKETSGILVLAKHATAFSQMQEQFKARTVKKTYLALVHGDVVPGTGTVSAPIDRLPWNRERFGVVPGGKEAITDYEVIGTPFSVEGEKVSEVALFPRTGRTHQIRVHMKYINHPLLGDYLYAGRVTSRNDREWANRVMLHAWKLTCKHPTSGESLDFEAPIPDDMNRIRDMRVP